VPRQAQLDLDVQLCFPIYAAARALTRAYVPLLEPVGLTYPQYLTMLALWSADHPLSVGEIGQRLRLDSATLTPLLKRLEAMELVTRERDPADERRVVIAPTRQGNRLRTKVAHVPGALFEKVDLSLNDSRTLRRILDSMLETLDATEDDE
jgi:MarR family transcriptional regulator, organic hydroperoxide resistance regulator